MKIVIVLYLLCDILQQSLIGLLIFYLPVHSLLFGAHVEHQLVLMRQCLEHVNKIWSVPKGVQQKLFTVVGLHWSIHGWEVWSLVVGLGWGLVPQIWSLSIAVLNRLTLILVLIGIIGIHTNWSLEFKLWLTMYFNRCWYDYLKWVEVIQNQWWATW